MAALPSLRQLRYLVAVGEYLNFTKAAEHCFVGQSTLSAGLNRKSTRLNSSHIPLSRMPSSA